jgi:predicted Fe-S protein YdhL (DUF1289 family)
VGYESSTAWKSIDVDLVSAPVPTPCIGICSTVFGDHVCRGCKRYAHEIIDWNAYDQDQKRCVERRLEQLLVQVLQEKFRILDGERLAARLKKQGLRFASHREPICWLHDLLRQAAAQVDDAGRWGFEILPGWRHLQLATLYEQVDSELFSLSTAHYERYLAPELQAWQPATTPSRR